MTKSNRILILLVICALAAGGGIAVAASSSSTCSAPCRIVVSEARTDGAGSVALDSQTITVPASTVTSTVTSTTPSTTSTTTSTTPPPPPGCTVTDSTIASATADLNSGTVVCLTAGTYGAVSITKTPSTNATLTAVPDAAVTVGKVNIAASNITVSHLHSTGGINVGSGGPYPGFSHDVIDHNDIGPTNGFGVSVLSATSTPSSFVTISNNKIHDTSSTGEGDAVRLDGWHDVTITGNDIYNIKECASSTCHTDTLQSYQGNVATSGLIITKNYLHDTDGAQGFPFLKDGDISDVTISDNLAVRMVSHNQTTGIWVDENINNLSITKNTYQLTSGGIVQSEGSASNPTAHIDHNVFDALNVKTGASGKAYALTEDYDIFTANNEYTFTLGPHDVKSSNPGFVNPATDDYRLASNPNGIGIDWAPTAQDYGP